jgi:hypothetical protein
LLDGSGETEWPRITGADSEHGRAKPNKNVSTEKCEDPMSKTSYDMERSINRRAINEGDSLWFAKFLADLLDQRFMIPGTSIRIGLDPIISLIPGIGDLLANLTGSLILIIAAQLGVPKVVLARMGANIAINTIIGVVPIFGDVISIWFRSNVRNVELLQRYLGRQTKRAVLSDWLFVIALISGLLILLGGVVLTAVWLFKQLWNSL